MKTICALIVALFISGCAAVPSTLEVRVDGVRMSQPAALAKFQAETGKEFGQFDAGCIDVFCAEEQWGRAIQASLNEHRAAKDKAREKERTAAVEAIKASEQAKLERCSKSRECSISLAMKNREIATATFAQTSSAIMDMGISPATIKATCERAVKGFKLGESDNSEATFIVSNHFLNAMIAYSDAGFQESAQLLHSARDSARYLADELSDACIEIHKANAVVAGAKNQNK